MRFFRLNHGSFFVVEGKDAPRYLQSRLTTDIRKLHVGEAGSGTVCLAAQLNAQGKCQGIFSVMRMSEQSFLLQSDYGKPAEMIQAFKKYIVADRVTVKEFEQNSSTVFHVIGTVPDVDQFSSYRINRDRGFGPGVDICAGDIESITRLESWLDKNGFTQIPDQEVEQVYFLHQLPRYSIEVTEDTLFSETNLTSAVDSNKGCYVGQEVIEKIESFGKAPKVIRAVKVTGGAESISVGTDVIRMTDGDTRKVGTVLSLCKVSSQETLLFIRIKNDEESSLPDYGRNTYVGDVLIEPL